MRLMFLLMLLTYVAANVYLFARGFHSLPWTGGRTVFAILFVIAVVSLFAGFLLENRLPATLVSVVQHIGGTWLILLVYLVPCVLIIDLVRLGDKLLHFLPDVVRSNPATVRPAVFVGIVVAAIAVVVAGIIKFNNPSVTRVEIPTSKRIGKVPSIVVASDLHLGYTIGAGKLRDFVELINSRNPDVVLLCGDLVDRSSRPVESEEMLGLLREIKAPGGVYAVFGNHEYYGDRDRNEHLFKEAGIVLLCDEAVRLTDDVWLVGREDRSNHGRKSLSEIMRGVDRDKFVILLDHQPHNLDEARKEGVDLQFSGHTHHGQIWPLSLITESIYEKSYGYLKKGETQYFVTSGLGLWGAWLRIGTCSEIVVPNIYRIK